jgi:hemerythrin superfamily protein
MNRARTGLKEIIMSVSKKPESDLGNATAEVEAPMAATDLLKKDHRTVSALFEQFENAEGDEEKVALAQQICTELTVHAEVEEQLFYPAARKALDEKREELIDEAAVEHRSLKMLIAEIDGSSAKDDLFKANVKVLKEYVEHHVKEEENEIFPRLRNTELDLDALGAKMAELKQELKEKVEAKAPRAGAKTVHVPSLSGREGSTSKAKSAHGASKSATSKTTHKAKSSGNGHKTASRSTSHSAHR